MSAALSIATETRAASFPAPHVARPFADDYELLEVAYDWAHRVLTMARAMAASRDQGSQRAPSVDPPPVSERRGSASQQLDLLTRAAAEAWSDLQTRCRQTQQLGLRSAFVTLTRAFAMTAEDQQWLLLAKALASDSRLRAFSQRTPTVALMLDALARSIKDRARYLGRIETKAPLRWYSLVNVFVPESRKRCPLEARTLEIDPSVSAFLEGRTHLPEDLIDLVRLTRPRSAPDLPASLSARKVELLSLLQGAPESVRPLRVALCGDSESQQSIAAELATAKGIPLLTFEAHWLFGDVTTLRRVTQQCLREVLLHNALLYVDCREAIHNHASAAEAAKVLSDALRALGAPVLLGTSGRDAEPLRVGFNRLIEMRIAPPSLDEQLGIWQNALAEEGLDPLSEPVIRRQLAIASVTASDITRAVRVVHAQAVLANPQAPVVTAERLRTTVVSRLNRGLTGLAERLSINLGWEDVILPDDVLERMMEIVSYARYRTKVFEEWGFAEKLPYGRANSALFSGPPGTGKTMMAGIIAKELGMDLYRVEVSRLVDKYIGETEKNLARVFDEAERGQAIILFDEADCLFAKRTEVKSSNDRYSNLEINYLLQRMETFDGVTILTTNLSRNIDEAFSRRIRFKVEFPFPTVAERARLWQSMMPGRVHMAPGVSFTKLAQVYELAGGNIKNACVRAAFAAAERGEPLSHELLAAAAFAEAREMGRLVRDPSYRA